MSSETTSILGAIGKFFGMLLFGKIQEYYEKKKLSTVSFVVIPSGSGKTKLVETFKSEFGLSTDLYLLDIEDAVLKEVKNAPLLSQLKELKEKDVLIYESKLFQLCKEYLDEILQHLKATKHKKHIVVLTSSKELKRYLDIKTGIYYAPTKKLFEALKSKNPANLDYLNYTRNLLSEKDAFVFETFEQLYNQFLKDLKIERTI